jgi:hypothetical protein
MPVTRPTPNSGSSHLSNQRELAKETGVAQGYINQASIVLEYANELVDAVIADLPER